MHTVEIVVHNYLNLCSIYFAHCANYVIVKSIFSNNLVIDYSLDHMPLNSKLMTYNYVII